MPPTTLMRMFTTLRPAMPTHGKQVLLYVVLMLAVEWWQRHRQHALQFPPRFLNAPLRVVLYYAIIAAIFFCAGCRHEFHLLSVLIPYAAAVPWKVYSAHASSCSHRSFSTLCSILCATLSRCCALMHLSTIMMLRPGSISMPTMSVR